MNIAFVPVRLASNRFPCKAALSLNGKTIIQHLIENLKYSKKLDKIIVATTTESLDDIVQRECDRLKVTCLRGSEEDILDRIENLIHDESISRIIRVTGDCPLVDPGIIDSQIEQSYEFNLDCIYYDHQKYTIGLGGEVYKRSALLKLKQRLNDVKYSEYLIYYFLNNPQIFSSKPWIGSIEYETNYHLTLDYESDLILFSNIFHEFEKNKLSNPFRFIEYKEKLDLNNLFLSNSNNPLKYNSNIELKKNLDKWTKIMDM